MRIEETCTCGAKLTLSSDSISASLSARANEEARGWREIEKWRRLHRVCRQAHASTRKEPSDG